MDRAVTTKRPTNVSLDSALVAEARRLGVNLSQACEHGLRLETAAARAAAWIDENAAAIAASNDYVATHDLPLAALRRF